MPFLNEEELLSLKGEIEKANDEKDELETDLEKVEEELSSVKKSSRKINLLFGILSGLAMALALFFYMNSGNKGVSSYEIAEIKKMEAERVIDSLQSVQSESTESNSNSNSIESDIDTMKSSVNNETVYSVQIGAFSENRYPLLSEIIAGTASQADLLKYSVGLFKTLKEAQDFRRELVKIGFNDAFVASYINGKRQQIEHPN